MAEGYSFCWLDGCEFIDGCDCYNPLYFRSFHKLIEYALSRVKSTDKVDNSTKAYIIENLLNQEWDCDCYLINSVHFND